jgi:hypothetical protein
MQHLVGEGSWFFSCPLQLKANFDSFCLSKQVCKRRFNPYRKEPLTEPNKIDTCTSTYIRLQVSVSLERWLLQRFAIMFFSHPRRSPLFPCMMAIWNAIVLARYSRCPCNFCFAHEIVSLMPGCSAFLIHFSSLVYVPSFEITNIPV